MDLKPILLDGEWRQTAGTGRFLQSTSPLDGRVDATKYPVSSWVEIDQALDAAHRAFAGLMQTSHEVRAQFLERYADRISACSDELVRLAHEETALPVEPRLKIAELPRTINQLKTGAKAVRERSWAIPTIDAPLNIRSMLRAIGPVFVFGPNNFPFACNAIVGGDFTAAIAVGCPVIAKANPGHLRLHERLAIEANLAAKETGMPKGSVQMIYHMENDVGLKMASDPRVGAIGFTGSKAAGIALKTVADYVGKPIYLELGSVNPVVVLPGALEERLDAVVTDFVGSCLLGTGQFCTNPGLTILLKGAKTDAFIEKVVAGFKAAAVGPLLGEKARENLVANVNFLIKTGAKVLAGGKIATGPGFHFENTLLLTTGKEFLARPHDFQTEAFGNAGLLVVADSIAEIALILESCEGSLTGCFYSHSGNVDDDEYRILEPILRQRVGRLLNDKMPTGVTVSPATCHGGPFPAAGHPGFTAIGVPASLRRFAALHCYENLRESRLPPELRNQNLSPAIWRFIAGTWTKDDVK